MNRINATSFFKLSRRASIKLSVQESELVEIFPDFNSNQESLASEFARSLEAWKQKLLVKILETVDDDIRQQLSYPTITKNDLQQATYDLLVDPSADFRGSFAISHSVCGMVIIFKAIAGMLTDNKPARAIIFLQDLVVGSSVEKMVDDDLNLANLFWNSFCLLRGISRAYAHFGHWAPPKTVTENPGFFGDTSWMFSLEDFAEPCWYLRDCLGGLIHSLLERLGREEHSKISQDTQNRFIQRIITWTGAETRNVRDIWGQSPLHYAARYNIPGLLPGLLAAGAASPNEATYQGHTALHYAAAIGNVETCQLLLSNGAGLNFVDSNEYTALAYAAKKGNREVVDLLLRQDLIDPNISPQPLTSRNYMGRRNIVEV